MASASYWKSPFGKADLAFVYIIALLMGLLFAKWAEYRFTIGTNIFILQFNAFEEDIGGGSLFLLYLSLMVIQLIGIKQLELDKALFSISIKRFRLTLTRRIAVWYLLIIISFLMVWSITQGLIDRAPLRYTDTRPSWDIGMAPILSMLLLLVYAGVMTLTLFSWDRESDASVITKCQGCEAEIMVKNAGKFRCPACKAVGELKEDGSVEFEDIG